MTAAGNKDFGTPEIFTPTTKNPVKTGMAQVLHRDTRNADIHDLQETQDTHDLQRTAISSLSECLKNPSVSISEVVDHALKENERQESDSNPEYYHEYRTPLWSFTRAAKGFFIDGTDPDLVFEFIEEEITSRGGWTILELPVAEEEIYEEFIYTWDRIKGTSEQDTLRVAYDLAYETPLEPERSVKRAGGLAGYSEFVSIAGWAQVLREDETIYLPCELVAELLNTNKMRVTRWRNMAIKDGYLQVVGEHSVERRKATEFRFDVSQFPELTNGEKIKEE